MMLGIKSLTTSLILIVTFFPLFSNTPSDTILTDLKLDHVNIAVKDLEAAKRMYEKLGFSIKPGRLHKNSILNAFTKFKDGSLLELITASKKADGLSTWYVQFIKENPAGHGAFVAFKVETENKLESLNNYLSKRKLPCNYSNSGYARILSFDTAHLLHTLFFIYYKGKISDKPVHLNHPNTVQSLHAVWLSEVFSTPLTETGFKSSDEIALPFFQKSGRSIKLETGEIYILPTQQTEKILGVTLLVNNLTTAKSIVEKGAGKKLRIYKSKRGKSFVLPPELTFGIWIEFLKGN